MEPEPGLQVVESSEFVRFSHSIPFRISASLDASDGSLMLSVISIIFFLILSTCSSKSLDLSLRAM